ncbi:MAG: carboxylating nicotinate-nucleotide diphosphorylase, partial [Desulfobacterales bacterium]|nr:carboxylating nicotinate-nucleotide diphosphorylase [Desulfobacterales bacterium]
ALLEDIGSGDRTTSFLVGPEMKGRARVIAKEDLVLAGTVPFKKTFQALSPDTEILFVKQEGSVVVQGETIAELTGSLNVLLTGERTALNFLQRLCGIATGTRRYVEKLQPFKSVLLDTRKTTPGWRVLEKEAVSSGGGTNHRMGLFDAVLIKDNHLAVCGGIRSAIKKAKKHRGPHMTIEVEVKNLEELREALDEKPDIIMLDNMSIETMKQAVEMTGGAVPLEASGNITLETIEQVASTGVDYISAGAVTHSAQAVDISIAIVIED